MRMPFCRQSIADTGSPVQPRYNVEHIMKSLRKYGKIPFDVAVIHGGPGTAGEMAPVARKLAIDRGVLEPFQTAFSIKAQIHELKAILSQKGMPPVTLIGFSWGAWLSFLFAAKYPTFVKKLILIGSGPFEAKYAANIQKTRLSRLNNKEKLEAGCPATPIKRRGELFSRTDTYDRIKGKSEPIDFRADIFECVWKQASEMRRTGKLLRLAKDIQCPVVAIHGDYDPHPAEGVQKPLTKALKDFRFILLKNCGHKPWIERQARKNFYKILEKELG